MTTIVTRTGKGSPLTHAEVDTNFTNLNTNKLETAAIPLGTAAAPSISFVSDPNTGIFSPGADQLAISTNGVPRLTTSTTAVSSSLAVDHPLGAEATPSITFTGDLNTGFYSPAADTLAAVTAGSNRLHITSGGLVGIGTSSPATSLHVTGAIRAGSSTSYAQINANQMQLYGSTGSPFIKFADYNLGTSQTAVIGWEDNFFGAGSLAFTVKDSLSGTGITAMTLGPTGKVGIGTSSVSNKLHLSTTGADGFRLAVDGQTYYHMIRPNGDGLYLGADDGNTGGSGVDIRFNIKAAEKMRIDSSGRLLVGTSTARDKIYNGTTVGNIPQLQSEVSGDGVISRAMITGNCGTGISDIGPALILARSTGTTVNSYTAVTSVANHLGSVSFQGADGTEFVEGARIEAFVDGTPGANDMPGRLVFSTTADNGSSPTERMRITAGGDIHIGTGATDLIYDQTSVFGVNISKVGAVQIARNNDALLLINRIGGDGNLVLFSENGTLEGSISVSGTTVSYNGAHLSRWSQLASGAERTEILRGSVLSNIDEMCEWGDEENEQLNRMKVSTVQGDKNVSGVFQSWDDDDDTYINDFYCAMTGDFIIRIAEGITIERGDLLMSAGDGTAKPQDDDIIRSKTIAKVTSTNVSFTYADGSYCVPCVLMVC